MYTSSHIRKYVFNLPTDVIFTTRDVVHYGRRSVVDQTLYRLVKADVIVRLAWGVFIKAGSRIPPLAAIVAAKAQAFGKQLFQHGEMLIQAHQLKEDTDTPANVMVKRFAVSGRSSSFRIGDISVKLFGISARKIELSKTVAGQAALALWTLGQQVCQQEQIGQATRLFGRQEREFLKQSKRLLPAWLADMWWHNRTSYEKPSFLIYGGINQRLPMR